MVGYFSFFSVFLLLGLIMALRLLLLLTQPLAPEACSRSLSLLQTAGPVVSFQKAQHFIFYLLHYHDVLSVSSVFCGCGFSVFG